MASLPRSLPRNILVGLTGLQKIMSDYTGQVDFHSRQINFYSYLTNGQGVSYVKIQQNHIFCDGAILHDRPQITSDCTIHKGYIIHEKFQAQLN